MRDFPATFDDSPKTHCFEQCRASRNPFWPAVKTVAVRPENAKDRCGCSSWLFNRKDFMWLEIMA
jgi:hypothetical protein